MNFCYLLMFHFSIAKNLNRKLILEKLMAHSEALVSNDITPLMIPQILDPRITIQTFNSPNNPIIKGVLPQPKVDLFL